MIDALHAGRADWHRHLATHECCRQHGTICPRCRRGTIGWRGIALRFGNSARDLGAKMAVIALVADMVGVPWVDWTEFASGAAVGSCLGAFMAWRVVRLW